MSPSSRSARLARGADLVRRGWGYGVAMLAHPTHLPTTFAAMGRGAHLGETLKLAEQHKWMAAAGIRTVIDVGAHTGQFSSALRHFFPQVQIYAFEPIPECHRRLADRFASDPRFRAYEIALGDHDGEITFRTSSFPKASSALPMTPLHEEAFPWSAETAESTVQVRTLDSYADDLELAPEVLLKLDVQGYEGHVLRGATSMLERTTYVLVELSFAPLYEGQADFDSIYRLLIERGFAYAGSWDQLTSPIDHRILQADALFTRAR